MRATGMATEMIRLLCLQMPLVYMSVSTYTQGAFVSMRKPQAWLHGEVKTPPFSVEARIEVGVLLRHLQEGINISLPHSRPMPTIGRGCHELRIPDQNRSGALCITLIR